MKGLGIAGLLLALSAAAGPADAHPVPTSYVDVRIGPRELEVAVVAHLFDLGHDLTLGAGEALLEPAVLAARRTTIASLLSSRLMFDADDHRIEAGLWTAPEILADRQSMRVTSRYQLPEATGQLSITANLFPYDPQHQTFVNVYESGAIATQAILNHERTRLDYFPRTNHGRLALIRTFITEGVRHIVAGRDHLLFLTGLLLLGGTFRQRLLLVSAFAVANGVTLSLASLNVVAAPARLIDPGIALTLVYLGLDNLLVRDGRDMRGWIALAFGLIHGFGFAETLRAMDLPRAALDLSLASFTVGVEIGQLLVVVAIWSILAALRSRIRWAGQPLAVAGSVAVMAIGTFWFIERVFFSSGPS
jgi:hypothetical protein